MKILLENARILTMIDDKLVFGDLVIEDDRIVYIGLDSDKHAPFDVIHKCNGNVIMPGFKNAHTHSAMTFLRTKQPIL